MIEIVDNILYGMDHGKHVAGIYMDLSKTFDTVDHEILFQKLQHYGIRGLPLQWFKSYLTNRKQYTIANKATSEESTITYGVPQGSVLGPLLFLIYTNDITNAISGNHKVKLFADDTNIFVTCDCYSSLFQMCVVLSGSSLCPFLPANGVLTSSL